MKCLVNPNMHVHVTSSLKCSKITKSLRMKVKVETKIRSADEISSDPCIPVDVQSAGVFCYVRIRTDLHKK